MIDEYAYGHWTWLQFASAHNWVNDEYSIGDGANFLATVIYFVKKIDEFRGEKNQFAPR